MHTLKTLLVAAGLLVGTGCVTDAFAGHRYDPAGRVVLAEASLAEARGDLHQLLDARERLVGDRIVLERRIDELTRELDRIEGALARHRLANDPTDDGQIRAIENALLEEQRRLERLEVQVLADLRLDRGYRQTLEQLADARRRLDDVKNARWAGREDLENARRLVDLLERELETMELAALAGDRQIALLQSRVDSLRLDRERRLEALARLAEPPAHLLRDCELVKAHLAEARADFEQTCSGLAVVERDIDRVEDAVQLAELELVAAERDLRNARPVLIRDRVVIDAHVEYDDYRYSRRPVIVKEHHRPVIIKEHHRPVIVRENPRVIHSPAGVRPGFRDADNADAFRRVHDPKFTRSERTRDNTAPTRAGGDRGDRYR